MLLTVALLLPVQELKEYLNALIHEPLKKKKIPNTSHVLYVLHCSAKTFALSSNFFLYISLLSPIFL